MKFRTNANPCVRPIVLLCLWTCLLMSACASAQRITSRQGTDYYVSTTGSNTNNGSISAPFRTIQHAAFIVNPGDIVHVLPGTYPEAVEVSRSGTSTARIVFLSDTQWGALVTGDGTIADAFLVHGANYVDVVGFEVTNQTGYQGIELNGSYGAALGNHVHNVWAHGCTDWLGGAGINSSNYSATGNQIIGNMVHDIGDFNHGCASVHGIYLANAHNIVQNNISYRNQGWGITSWHQATHNTIVNNTVFNNDVAGINTGAGDNGVVDDYSEVGNNIVMNNGTAINWVCYPAGNYSPSCADPQNGIGQEGANGPHDLYTNNVVYGNEPADVYVTVGTVSDTITATPSSVFVNYTGDGTGDYHLLPGSPAVNGGTSEGAPGIDYAGGPRPINGTFSIGAYEYGADPGPWPWYYATPRLRAAHRPQMGD